MKSVFLFLLIVFSGSLGAQSKWNNYLGFYFTGDAEMYYTGISVQLGSEFHLKHHLSISPYIHYFSNDKGDHSFEALSAAVLLQWNFGKKKRLYVASGLAFQRAVEEDNFYTDTIDRSIFLPAYRFGHEIPINRTVLCPEICLTGPYHSGHTTELFTLPSIGIRLYRQKSNIDNLPPAEGSAHY
ncbi:hypothetical protein GCM10009122_25630 [Fulvivirga kasyanovii]|uniref:DUF3575 domain-containing protein n=1 Tax=Fulvivirga kasyanovii TaxID=396812 RepID=A0ABW9RQ99_9BACT|nr:hypothetical protein [Fulvivirga kasyanovii]MTI26065.1 hypothetical protein [Fulvivirga kasyanovii]